MHAFDTWLDRFCSRHRNLAIPNLMLYIVIIQAAVFLLDSFSTTYSFSSMLAFIPSAIFHQMQLWRLITFIFVPEGDNLLFMAISLYFYYSIGSALERHWGSTRFTVFYLMGVVFNILVGLVLTLVYSTYFPFSVTSMYYINLSLFFSFASLYPNLQLLLFFVIPIKVKWLAWFNAALFGWSVVSSLMNFYWIGVLLPLVAMLNYFLFFAKDAMAMIGRVKYQHSRQTINFKKATREAKREKGYLHKCSVCGITDTDHPDMEFRYCSKCEGYHCYCMDHINSHIHVQ